MPLVLDPIQSGYNLSKINDNFQRIEDAWDEKLDRVNSGSFYNQMDQTLDMNSNEIINVKVGDTDDSLVNKGYVDQQDELRVLKAGDSMSGQLNTIDPVQPSNATNKRYVDGMIATIDGVEGIVPLVSPRQQGDGVTTVFPTIVTSQHPTQSYSVNLDGVTQRPQTDFTADTNGNVVFAEAPEVGVDIDITVFEPVNLQEAADLSQVTATGSTTPRTLADRFAGTANVVDFGAVGDGVADDTSAINLASASGKSVVFPKGRYRCTGKLTTSVSWEFLDGASIVIAEPVANMIEIVPEYTKTILGQGDVVIGDFVKYANKLSNLDDYPNHFMVVDSTQLDFNRNRASMQTYTKNSVTLLGENGVLAYPLTTTFNSISRIELSPTNIKRAIFKNLTVELDGAPTTPENMISVTRNCVDFHNTRYVDKTTNSGQIDLQSFVSISYAFDVTFDKITCDALSEGRLDFNYTILTWKSAKIRIKELRSFDGWAQLDGNHTRDVVVRDSTIDRIGGHYAYWDCTFDNITANQSRCIDVSGGGRLDVRNLNIRVNPDFLSGNELYAVAIRGDYAAEWDGDVLVDGVTVDARSIKGELTSETIFNIFSSFADSSSAGFNYGRPTTVAKTVTVRAVRFYCSEDSGAKWVLRACALGYVGAPVSDAQYTESVTVEDVAIVTKDTSFYHQIRALDWFGDVKPATIAQTTSINIKGVNNNDPAFAGQSPSSGLIDQVPTLSILNQDRNSIDVAVSDCNWLKIHSNGHPASPTKIDVVNSRLYYVGGDFDNRMTFNGCNWADTRFEGSWKGTVNSGWFEDYEKSGGGFGNIGFPNNIETNLSGVANVLLGANTTMTTSVHDSYTIYEGTTDGTYWQDTVRPIPNPTFRSGANNPTGVVTPLYLGEEYLDTSPGQFNFYKATGLAISNWKQITA
ncbi:hypothetical protein PODOV026v1_p0062 [Vibrio phage PS32B.1]|nr:hypothetical protein PODOV028v1_30003 [Vibrio phage PS32B.3]QZI92235.1 hypothetical protein PODOV026v1_p0062 [Vibrio phage PS32B.1]